MQTEDIKRTDIVVFTEGPAEFGTVLSTHTYAEAGKYANVKIFGAPEGSWVNVNTIRLATTDELLTLKS